MESFTANVLDQDSVSNCDVLISSQDQTSDQLEYIIEGQRFCTIIDTDSYTLFAPQYRQFIFWKVHLESGTHLQFYWTFCTNLRPGNSKYFNAINPGECAEELLEPWIQWRVLLPPNSDQWQFNSGQTHQDGGNWRFSKRGRCYRCKYISVLKSQKVKKNILSLGSRW